MGELDLRGDFASLRAGSTTAASADQALEQGREPPILFIHVPGTGGDDVVEYIRRANPNLSVREVNSPLSDRDIAEIKQAQFVYGNILWPDIVKYFSGWRKLTLLQEPAARLYASAMAQRNVSEDGRAFPPRRDSPNGYVRQFTYNTAENVEPPPSRSLVEAAKANLASLDYILIEGMHARALSRLCARLGLEAAAAIDDEAVRKLKRGNTTDVREIRDDMTAICEAARDGTDREIYFDVLENRLGAPYVKKEIRPLIAFVSPIFPQEFGVPVYSLLTAKALYQYARLDLVNPTAPPAEAAYFNAHIDMVAPRRLVGYDNYLFVFGNNSHLHKHAISIAKDVQSGVCIYHDAQMLDTTELVLGPDGLRYLAEKELGRAVFDDEVWGWFTDRSRLPCPLLTPLGAGRFVDVVHSPVQRAVHGACYPRSQVVYLPHAIQHRQTAEQVSPIGRIAARAIVGIPIEQVAIASCGAINELKRSVDIVFALAHLHDWQIKAHIYFVGMVGQDADNKLRDIAGKFGLQEYIHFTGRVSEEIYMQYLAAADVGVQLRLSQFGQLSGGLIDCIAAALPTVTPVSLAAALEAPSFIARVPDVYSSVDVARALEQAVRRGRVSADIDEWHAYVNEHSFERYGRRLAYLLEI